MNKSLLLALPLLVDAALASNPPPADDAPPPLITGAEADGARQLYHTPLNALLIFVCNRETADAAAPRVRELLSSGYRASSAGFEDDVLRHLRYSHNFFGSSALAEALAPILSAESPELQQFKLATQQLKEKHLTQERALAQTIAAVCDAETEARAIAALQAFPAYMKAMDKELCISSEDFPNDDDFLSAVYYFLHSTAPLVSLYHAYGQVQASREGGYPALRNAMHELFFTYFGDELTERLRRQVETRLAAAEKNNCEQLHAAAREWLGIAASIHDKASADAAAAWLKHKNAELHIHLRDLWREDCPCLSNMAEHLHFAHSYMEKANPSYYGSAVLKALLYVEPVPAPITPKSEETDWEDDEEEEVYEDEEDVSE